jgi:hypothetical protein
MASGHVNRVNRPNTWLLRPLLKREEIPCQAAPVSLGGRFLGISCNTFTRPNQT